MTEDEIMETLLANISNLHCYNCGKTIGEFAKGAESLLGCLWFESGDESVGLGELVYWECPDCSKEANK